MPSPDGDRRNLGANLGASGETAPAAGVGTKITTPAQPPTTADPSTNPSVFPQQQHPGEKTNPIRRASDVFCSGIGQVMFGDNPLTGAVFFVCLSWASPLMAAGTAVGSCIGSLWALARGYPGVDVKNGIYGFNAALVGLATMSKFEPSIVACFLMGVGCVASTEITRVMKEAKLAHYTAPFVASTWATWAIGLASGWKTNQNATSLLTILTNFAKEFYPSLYPVGEALSNIFIAIETFPSRYPVGEALFNPLKGLGQVFLQESAVVGVIFAVGLLVSSRKAAVAGLAGAGVASYVAALTGFSSVSIGQGLLGYNAALCAIALTGDEATDGGKPFDKKKVIYAAIASLATLPLYAGFEFMGVPPLTAPFVLSTWLVSSLMPKKEPASPN